jgi:hypothetical protein
MFLSVPNPPREPLVWRIVIAVLQVLGAFAVAIIVLIVWTLFPHDRGFYMEHADFENRDRLAEVMGRLAAAANRREWGDIREENTAFEIHRVKPGSGAVLIYDWGSGVDWHHTDTAMFRRLTIWVPSLPRYSIAEFQLGEPGGGVAFYSRGNNIWRSKTCFWEVSKGKVNVDTRGWPNEVHIIGELDGGVFHKFDYEMCDDPKTLDLTFTAQERRIEPFNPPSREAKNHP